MTADTPSSPASSGVKVIRFLLAVAMCVLLPLSQAQNSYAIDLVGPCLFSGDGTSNSPFEIAYEQDLQCLHDNLDYTIGGYSFIQTSDITLTQTWNDGIGAGSYRFNGSYDGQNHSISQLFIEDGNGTDHENVGFFDSLDDMAIISNIVLLSPRVRMADVSVPSGSIGIVAGSANGATIDNVTVDSGELFVDSSHVSHIGGFTGYSRGQILNSSLLGSGVIISADGGGYNIGGFIGTADSEAQFTGNTVFDSRIDGTFGGEITNFGGFVGQLQSSTISDTDAGIDVYVTTTTGQLFSAGGLFGASGRNDPEVDIRSVISGSTHTGVVSAISGRGAVYGVGGIGGSAIGTSIQDVQSNGNVTGNNLDWEVLGVGGLFGIIGDLNCDPEASDCSNFTTEIINATYVGDVESSSVNNNVSYVGGQIGFSQGSSISHTSSSGNVSVNAGGNDLYHVGGAVGGLSFSTLNFAQSGPGVVSIIQGTGHTAYNVGGVVGTSLHSNSTGISSSNVVQGNSLLNDPNSSQYAEGAGGLVGSLVLSAIDSGLFTGDVYGVQAVGGIAGVNESSSVSNISVTGNVYGPAASALFGYLYANYNILVSPLTISKVVFSGELFTDSDPVLIADMMASDDSILSIMEYVLYSDSVEFGWLDQDYWEFNEVTAIPLELMSIPSVYPQIDSFAQGFELYLGFEPQPVSNNVAMSVWGICQGTSVPFIRSITIADPCPATSPNISFESIHLRENTAISSPISLTPVVAGFDFSGNANGGGIFWNESNLSGCDVIPSGIQLNNESQWTAPGEIPIPTLSNTPGFNTAGTYNICIVYQDDFGAVAIGNLSLIVDPLVPAISLSSTSVEHGGTLVYQDNLQTNRTLAIFVDGSRVSWGPTTGGITTNFAWTEWGNSSSRTVIFRIYDVAFSGLGSGPTLSTSYSDSESVSWAGYTAPSPSPTPSPAPTPTVSPSPTQSPSPTPAPSVSANPARTISLAAQPGMPIAGSDVNYLVQDLLIGSNWNLTLRSTPVVLQNGVVGQSGSISQTVSIPNGLEPGWHSLTFVGSDPAGNRVETVLWFRVSNSGFLLESTTSPTASQLAITGIPVPNTLNTALILIVVGIAFMALRRRLMFIPKRSQQLR